jgi:hypothetical protein
MSIVEPHQLETDLSPTQLSELFVEMSFFARLGFVQPPCCLQCTYRESINRNKEAAAMIPNNTHCGRWVVWRRNAKRMLHPHDLDNGNLVVVRCRVARQLLAGKVVPGGYKWDKELQQLIEPRVNPTTTTNNNNNTTNNTKLTTTNNNNKLKKSSTSLLEASNNKLKKSSTSLLEASKWSGFDIQ